MVRLPRLLDSNLKEVRRIEPIDGSLSLSIIPLSTASLTLSSEQMIPVHSWVEMYNALGSVGVYRVRTAGNTYGSENSVVELDHAIVEVGDFICDTTFNKSAPLNQAIAELFTFYKGNKWRLGANPFTDEVVLDTAYESVLEGILGLLRQVPEYVLSFDFSVRPWAINVVRRGTVVSAEGRLSRNIQEASVSYDDSELCTRVYIEIDEGNGKTRIEHYDSDTIGTYGVIEKFLSGSYDAQQAPIVARSYLNSYKKPIVAISITGYDFYISTGEDLDKLELGKLYRLALPKYGVTVEENITGLDWGHLYSNPNDIEISLADVEDPVVAFVRKQQSYSRGVGTAVVKKDKEYWTRFDQTDYRIDLTANHVSEHEDIFEQAGMYLDAQHVLIYATKDPNNIGSMFNVQSDKITAEVNRATEAEGELNGRLTVQADRITAEVNRATTSEGRLSGRIDVTATAITQEVTRATNAEGTLSGRLTITENAITQEVTRATGAESSLSGRITTNANKVAIVVEEKNGQNVVKAASIVTAINDSGSSVGIDADHVFITGNTKLSGQLTVQDGSLLVKTALLVSGTTGGQVSINNGSINAKTHQINSGGSLKFIGGGTGEYYDLDTTILKGMVKSFSVSGDTLTLTPFYGDPVNFRKAAPVLSGSWSGRTFTVTETVSGQTYSETPTYTTGSGYGSNDSITVDSFSSAHYAYARVLQSSGQGGNVLFGFKVDARGQYNSGWIYGQSQIVRTTRAATSQETTIKTLDYSERFTIVDTYTKPDGTTSEVKYTVESKADRYTPAVSDIGFDQLSLQPSTASISGRHNAGSFKKSNLSAPGYIFFRVGCRGTNKLYYLTVNT